jgi:hypothetical protein
LYHKSFRVLSGSIDGAPPNVLRVSRAAQYIGIAIQTKSVSKMRTILGPRSGVGCTPWLGGGFDRLVFNLPALAHKHRGRRIAPSK